MYSMKNFTKKCELCVNSMILGHESCAEVVEVGSEVKDFKPGDRNK